MAEIIYIPLTISFFSWLIVFILLYFIHNYQNKKTKKLKSIPFLIATLSILTGLIMNKIADERHFKNHFIHFTSKDSLIWVEADIQRVLKKSNHYKNYLANVKKVGQQKVKGKLLIHIPITEPELNTKHTIQALIPAHQIKEIFTAVNPESFDYRKHMKYRNVYREVHIKDGFYRVKESKRFNIIALSETWREKIKENFEKSQMGSDELLLAFSLLLGERQELSQEILNNFKAAGTIHILAISGLHIGILLLFLNFVFKPLKVRYKVLYLILTVGFLWLYAFMTGFSPSVFRAVTMFSILAVSLEIKRKTNIYNTLSAAALIMLVIHPNFLFQVGFQMSFLAVLSIVSFYPIFKNIYQFQNKFLQWLLDLFWVSVSAQIGILPLTLYYFHQFPIYFLIANLLVIPLLFIILFIGFGLIILSVLSIHFNFLFQIFGFLINLLLSINEKVASLEKSLITHIDFPFYLLIISFLGVILFYRLLKYPKTYINWYFFLVWVIVLQLALLFQQYERKNREVFYVFHHYKHSVTAYAYSDTLKIFQKEDLINPYLKNTLQRLYQDLIYDSLPVFQKFGKYNILHIDSLGIYQFNNYQPDWVILHHSPKINLDKMINRLQPKMIIADATNYPSYVQRWKKSAERKNITFYNISKLGAWVFNKKTQKEEKNSR